MERKCKNCKKDSKEKMKITEMHLGMQKMIVDAVTAYLFSEEAEELGITEVHIVRKEDEDSIGIESSFVKGTDKDFKEPFVDNEDEDYEDEDYEDEEDGEDNEPDTEILKDIFDFLSNLSELAERKDENVKPKSKRGRKKKTDE